MSVTDLQAEQGHNKLFFFFSSENEIEGPAAFQETRVVECVP